MKLNPHTLLLLAALQQTGLAHNCVHDNLDHNSQEHKHETLVTYENFDNERKLTASQQSNMRFTWRMGNTDALTAEQVEYLESVVLGPAAQFWSNSLQVTPVVQPFFFSPCVSYWQTSTPRCYQVNPTPMCGEVQVPVDFLEETTYCDGCASTGSSCCFSADNCGTCETTTQYTNSTGVIDSDFIILVNAVETNQCGGSTVAYAAACLRDQLGRPIGGYINFCPQDLFSSNKPQEQQDIDNFKVGVHELGHALGFSSSSFSLFIDNQGTARSPQDSVQYDCGGSTFSYIPPIGSIQSFSERGVNASNCPYPTNGSSEHTISPGAAESCVLKMTTEAVVRESKAYFGCDTIQGAELENKQGSSCSIVSSHLEQRIFNYDIMSPLPLEYDELYISPVTLAFFEDSGWYNVNYTAGSQYQTTEVWGENAGCEFAIGECVKGSQPSNEAHFCADENLRQCMVGRLSKGYCGITTHESIPDVFQYFSTTTKGGKNIWADYCPMIQSQGSNGNCRFPATTPSLSNNYQGEVYSEQSRCFDATLKAVIDSKTLGGEDNMAACYRVSGCTQDSYNLWVLDPNNSGAEVKVECSDSDQNKDKSVAGFLGTVHCAPASSVCSQSLKNSLHPTFSPVKSPTSSPITQAPTPNVTETPIPGNSSANVTATNSPTTGAQLNNSASFKPHCLVICLMVLLSISLAELYSQELY